MIKETQFIAAMTKTLNAYEEAIEDFYFDKWSRYGTHAGCSVCKVYSDSPDSDFDYEDCYKCPLNTLAINVKEIGCVTEASKNLEMAILLRNTHLIKPALKARMEELVKHLDKLGYEYKSITPP